MSYVFGQLKAFLSFLSRKPQTFLLLVLIVPGTTFGNVGVFDGFGQTIRLENTAQVQMVSEDVDIYLLRAGGRVTGSLQYVDRAQYLCRFALRNITNEVVTISAGFPLTADGIGTADDNTLYETEIISRFHFVAGSKMGSYPVRYVPYDKEKNYGKIFAWSMEFKPNETINLLVSYEMNGYSGLGNSARDTSNYLDNDFPSFLDALTSGILNSFGYVTTTGASWAGKIETAVFRIHLGEFEEYLRRRGATESFPTDPHYEKMNERPVLATLVRDVRPNGWQEKQDDQKGKMLVWKFSDFKPEQEIKISYLFCGIPSNLKEYEHYMRLIRRQAQTVIDRMNLAVQKLKAKGNAGENQRRVEYMKKVITEHEQILDPIGEKDVADTILEFYGNKTANQRILSFLREQTWFPVINPPEMDQELKEYLLQVSQR